MSSPCWPLAFGEKLLGGRGFLDLCGDLLKQRQGHKEPSSTLPNSPRPYWLCLTPHLQLGSGLVWVRTSSPWLQGDNGAEIPRSHPPSPRQRLLSQPYWGLPGPSMAPISDPIKTFGYFREWDLGFLFQPLSLQSAT